MRERGERRLGRSVLGALLLVTGIGVPPASVSGAVTPAAIAGPAIVGTIRDMNGPVAGISVTICDAAFADYCEELASSQPTDETGAYAVELVSAGAYLVRISSDEFHPTGWYAAGAPGDFAENQEAATTVVVGSDPVTVDVTLPRIPSISATITRADGAAVEGALVQVCAGGSWTGCTYAVTDGAGQAGTGALEAGSYRVRVDAPDPNPLGVVGGYYRSDATGSYTADESRASTLVLTSGDTALHIALPKGLQITGTVRGPGNLPVSGARVTICDPGEAAYCGWTTSTLSGSTGDFASDLLSPGSYRIQVEAPEPNPGDLIGGYYRSGVTGNHTTDFSLATAVAVSTGDATVTVTLPRGVRLVGRVGRSGGAAVVGAVVSLCRTDQTDWCDPIVTGESGEDGTYRTEAVPPGGAYLVQVEPAWDDTTGVVGGWYGTSGLVRTAGEAAVVTMTTGDRSLALLLPDGVRFSGRIAGPTADRPAADAWVSVCRLVASGCDTEEWTRTSSTGDFATRALFPGDLRLRASPRWDDTTGLREGWYRADGIGGFTRDETRATILRATAFVEMTLPSGHRISGTVHAPDGSPVADAWVVACERTWSCQSVRTASDGTYRTPYLDDGAYTVQVTLIGANPRALLDGWYDPSSPGASSREEYRASRVVLGVGDATGIDVTLEQGRTIGGLVLADDTSAPVDGADVGACSAAGRCAWGSSASDGSFLLGPLDVGRWTVAVGRPDANPLQVLGGWYAVSGGYARDEGRASVLEITAGSASPAPITVRLPRGARIRGTLLAQDGGMAVRGASVAVCPVLPGPCESISSGPTGDFTTGALELTAYTVGVYVPGHHPLRLLSGGYRSDGATNFSTDPAVRTAVTLPSEGLVLSTMRLPRGRVISGRITATDGTQPIVNALVQACGTTGIECSTVRTDEHGEFTTGTLLPGIGYRLQVSPEADDPNRVLAGWYRQGAPGNYDAAWSSASVIELSVDQTGLQMRLPRGSVISGRVRRADSGSGVAYARVTVYPAAGFGSIPETYTDENGDYTTATLAAGQYRIFVDLVDGLAEGWYAAGRTGSFAVDLTAATAIPVSGSGPRGVDVTLPLVPVAAAAPVSGRVLGLPDGVRGADVGLCSTSGDGCRWATADLDGSFSLPSVPAGGYRLQVTAPVGSGLLDGWYASGATGLLTQDGALASTIAVGATAVALLPITLPPFATPAPAPEITLQPASRSVLDGAIVVLTAAARSGTTPVVWWERSDDGAGSWSYYAGGSTTLAVQVFDGAWYRAVFAHAGGVSRTEPARLTIREPRVQTITFPLGSAGKAGSLITLSASATSGLPVTFVSRSTSVCSVSGTTLRLLAAGTCLVEAQQAGDDTWAMAQPVQKTVTVTLTKPVLTQRFYVGTSTKAVTSATIRKGTYLTDLLTTDKRLAGKSAALWVQVGGVWKRLVTVKVDSNGKARYKFRPSVTMKYQWRFTGTGIWASSVSSIYTVTVR